MLVGRGSPAGLVAAAAGGGECARRRQVVTYLFLLQRGVPVPVPVLSDDDGSQPSRPVDEARCLLAGYDAVGRLTRQENDDLPALALVAVLGLIDYFLQEHDLVEESWLRTAAWIDHNFDALRLPESALHVHLGHAEPQSGCAPRADERPSGS
jgi:hypothetical protein